ncbi:hypothetical protein Tco_1006924 [Tanacetum coccineum]|uniref:Uncharacterized protein n=1 Tax=Tanacetum coccineum TaxID=301880 RepID=A0ABQ5FJD9_9ASTR
MSIHYPVSPHTSKHFKDIDDSLKYLHTASATLVAVYDPEKVCAPAGLLMPAIMIQKSVSMRMMISKKAQRSHKSKEQSSKITTCSTKTGHEESKDYGPKSKINSKIARIQFVFSGMTSGGDC